MRHLYPLDLKVELVITRSLIVNAYRVRVDNPVDNLP
jgi:hypothetical protein